MLTRTARRRPRRSARSWPRPTTAARAAGPADDAAAAGRRATRPPTGRPSRARPGSTSSVTSPTASGEALGRARTEQRLLYGYVEHDVTTTYLGTVDRLRRRHEQPTAHIGITGKPDDLSTSGLGRPGGASRSTSSTSWRWTRELTRRLGWAERRVDLPAGRYDTVLPPTAVADLMIYAYYVGERVRTHSTGAPCSATRPAARGSGQRIASPGVRLRSDPAAPGSGGRARSSPRARRRRRRACSTTASRSRGPTGSRDGALRHLGTSRHTADG